MIPVKNNEKDKVYEIITKQVRPKPQMPFKGLLLGAKLKEKVKKVKFY